MKTSKKENLTTHMSPASKRFGKGFGGNLSSKGFPRYLLLRRLRRLLSLVWHCPMTVVGYVTALALRLGGHRPTRYHFCLHFALGRPGWGGLTLGRVILTCPDADERLRRHELGHALQNVRYGPAMVALSIASAVRFHTRNYLLRRGHSLPPYDAWWFEGQATRLGNAYADSHGGGEGGEEA